MLRPNKNQIFKVKKHFGSKKSLYSDIGEVHRLNQSNHLHACSDFVSFIFLSQRAFHQELWII
jgi:hypothetical protein